MQLLRYQQSQGLQHSVSPAAEAPHVLLQAQKIRTRLMTHYRRIFFQQGIDYVATPTTATTAPVIR